MAELFQNKYRVQSARKPGWDYGTDAAYFITLCVDGRRHEFGGIENARLNPTLLGIIADTHWLEIPAQFPYARLDVHVIMPNHMHGILIIDKACTMDGNVGRVGFPVETRLIASLPENQPRGGVTGEMNPMLHDNVSRIIRWYKGRCAFEMRKTRPGFRWQSRFYDHIIRNDADHERIRNYILNNPAVWERDKFYGS